MTTEAGLKFQVPSFKLETVEGAVEALKSPNESARYLAWEALMKMGSNAEPSLKVLFEDKKAEPQHRARALWLLATMGKKQYNVSPASGVLVEANSHTAFGSLHDSVLEDTDENIRITAIRAARQVYRDQPEKLREVIAKVVNDKSSAVRREAAIALRFGTTREDANLLGALVDNYAAPDRWFTEALGIADDRIAAELIIQMSKDLSAEGWRARLESILWLLIKT